jgi:hypothetical protein
MVFTEEAYWGRFYTPLVICDSITTLLHALKHLFSSYFVLLFCLLPIEPIGISNGS